jgi:integrase/recombinase XerD
LTFSALVSRWGKSQRISDNTKTIYAKFLSPFEHLLGEVPCSALTRALLAETADQIAALRRIDGKPRFGPQTFSRAMATVRSIFLWCDQTEQLGVPRSLAPALAGSGFKSGKISEKEYLTEVERAALLAATDGETSALRVAIALLFEVGLRHSELTGLEWQDLDLGVLPSVKIARQGNGAPLKTQSSHRTCPISSQLALAMRSWRLESPCSRDDDPVFFDTHGRHYAEAWQSLANALTRAAARAGIPKRVTPHTARHTVASLLQAQGHPVLFVSRFLGHANPTMTLSKYSHSSGDDLRCLVTDSSPLDKANLEATRVL